MREIFILLFGEAGREVYALNIDGVNWYPAFQLCKLLGIRSVSSAMRERWELLELYEEDKYKFRDVNVNKRSDVWFVSDKGFWKLLMVSKGIKAQMIRGWLATEYLPKTLRIFAQDPEIVERGFRRMF